MLEVFNNKIILVGILGILSFLLTFFIKWFTIRYKIMDIPNERSSHSKPTPRGGGLAIVIAWYLGISILFYLQQIDKSLYYALISGALLAIISLLDDVIDLKPVIRLIVQVITAVLALVFLNGVDLVHFLSLKLNIPYLVYPVAVMGVVWFINLFNFLDGIDAYVSVETISVAVILFLFTGNSIHLVLIACIIGFLYWNWPRAKIFMGDVGSTQLGFVLVVLGIYFHNSHQFSLWYWLILTSPFWFDATLTLIRRWRKKEKLSQAHKKHAYQRIVQAGFSHLKTDIYLMGINLGLFIVIFFSIKSDFLIIPAFVFVFIFMYWLTRLVDKRKPF